MWIPNLFLTFEHTAGESICPAHYNRLTILYREFRRASGHWCLGNLPTTPCARHYVLSPNKTPIRELLQGHIWKPEVLFRATHAFPLRVESTHLFMGLGLFPNLIKNVFIFSISFLTWDNFRFNIKVIQIVPIYLCFLYCEHLCICHKLELTLALYCELNSILFGFH